jgi:uncharacterized protein YcgL (UPF0745 family)
MHRGKHQEEGGQYHHCNNRESKNIKMEANIPDEEGKVTSSRPKLVMIWIEHFLKRRKLLDENSRISRSRYLHQGYNLQITQNWEQKDHDEAE